MNGHLNISLEISSKQLFSERLDIVFNYINEYDCNEEMKIALEKDNLPFAEVALNKNSTFSSFDAIHFSRLREQLLKPPIACTIQFKEAMFPLQEAVVLIEEVSKKLLKLKFFHLQEAYSIILINADLHAEISEEEKKSIVQAFEKLNKLLGNISD